MSKFGRQMVRTATTELTYAWLIDNIDAVVAMIPEFFRSNIVPALGGSFCSADRAREWEQQVLAQAEKLPGYERDLAQALESIRLCAVLKESRSDDLIAAFDSYN